MMEQTVEATTNNKLTKWGVRLIGLIFFLWAISETQRLIAGTSSNDFFGFYYSDNGEHLAFMAWAKVIFLAYITFQLLRFHSSGRYWALTIYWLLSLEGAGYSIWLTISWVKDFFGGKDFSFVWNFSSPFWQVEISDPPAILLYFSVVVVFFFIPTYFLMRKDVKQLFQKPASTGENH